MKKNKISDKNLVLISYLIKTIKSKNRDKQIGKTFLQKMIYLLTREGIVNFDYTIYYYGPYSIDVANEIEYANAMGYIKTNWVADSGYDYDSTSFSFQIESNLGIMQKRKIDEIINKFGKYKANELSIICTAYFLIDNYGVNINEITDRVHIIKPDFKMDDIKKLLIKSNILRAA